MLPSLTAARQDGGVSPFWKRRSPRKDTESQGEKVDGINGMDGIGTPRRFSFTFSFTFTNSPDRVRVRARARVWEEPGGLFPFTFAGLRNAHVV